MSPISRREFNTALLTSLGLKRLELPNATGGADEGALAADHNEVNAVTAPLIFPVPREMSVTGADFELDEEVIIAVPPRPTAADRQLARVISRDLSDWYGLGIRTVPVSAVPEGRRTILLGSISNPLVRLACERRGLKVNRQHPGREGYVLHVDEREVLVAGSDENGAFYGTQSLRQLIDRHEGRSRMRGVRVRDWPYKPFRGIYLFLPGRDHVGFFRRFVSDFMALYKFNKLILEFNAGMRFDRHPELAAGWIDFAEDMRVTRRDRPTGPHGVFQDSTHCDTADGLVIEKTEVEDMVRWASELHIEVIPEVASLTHSYYLLTRHRELAAIPTAEWPDTYCPSNPATYDLLFDVLDEIIEVTKPKMIHIGHDEWRIPLDLCPCCRGKNPTELFIQDVNNIHGHLAEKNIRTAMWGDHFIESLRGKGKRARITKTGYHYEMPGALTPDQVKRSIPKDILVGNWFWTVATHGDVNQRLLTDLGFEQFYGNFTPSFPDYARRSAEPRILGGAPSLWSATTEFNVGKDALLYFLGTADLLWGIHWPEEQMLFSIAQALMPKISERLRGRKRPSELGDSVKTIAVASSLDPIPIHADVSSVIFVHQAASPAFDEMVSHIVYNPADTAALLGWYEVVYEDGFVQTVPVRYGVNILESEGRRDNKPAATCYETAPVRADGETFFSYEWVNPRFGRKLREIRLHQTKKLTDLYNHASPQDLITLRSVGLIPKRSYPGPDKARSTVELL